jgi:phage terminase large subunit-like protein
LRLGDNPQVCITTTPRPIKVLKDLLADPNTVQTRGSTTENIGNLSPKFIKRVVDKYAGTRLGRQELDAEILDDAPGALWSRANIEANRIKPKDLPELVRIVIAIDPAVTSNEDSDETGIIAAGVDANGHGYVIEDASGIYKPHEWAAEAIALYRAKRADRIVAEINNGGEMVESTLRMQDPTVPCMTVHATRGKVLRAEPISLLYEKNMVHHVGGLAQLEDQQCAFTSDFDRKTSGYSPDRMDALVWALTELMVDNIPDVDIGGFFSVSAPPRRIW